MSVLKEDDDFTYYPGYRVPKHYTIPGLSQPATPAQKAATTASEQKTAKAAIDNLSLYAIAAAIGIASTAGVALALRKKRKKHDDEVRETK